MPKSVLMTTHKPLCTLRIIIDVFMGFSHSKKTTSFNKVIALEKWCLGSFPFNAPPMLQGLIRTGPCNGKTLPTGEGPRKEIPGPGIVDANIKFLEFAGCSLRIQ